MDDKIFSVEFEKYTITLTEYAGNVKPKSKTEVKENSKLDAISLLRKKALEVKEHLEEDNYDVDEEGKMYTTSGKEINTQAYIKRLFKY